jgi:hypothetical protein
LPPLLRLVTLKFIRNPVFAHASILRVLRALRGEFSLASVPGEPKLEVITHSERQGTLINHCGLDSPQLAANIVIPAHAGIQWFVRGHRPSPV